MCRLYVALRLQHLICLLKNNLIKKYVGKEQHFPFSPFLEQTFGRKKQRGTFTQQHGRFTKKRDIIQK